MGRGALAFALAGVLLHAPAAGLAEIGVSADLVRFGQTVSLTGSNSGIGRPVHEGIKAAFAEANRRGGVKGRRLELVTRDDGFDMRRAIDATRALLREDEVFALIGTVGTAIAQASLDIAAAAGAPFLAPISGADALRQPGLGHVVHLRASYSQEADALVGHLVGDLGLARIAILHPDDTFGRTGASAMEQALERRGLAAVASEAYVGNSSTVKRPLLEIRRAKPDAIIIVGTTPASAAFIKLAREIEMRAVVTNISVIDMEKLAAEVGGGKDAVIGVQVVPAPSDESFAAVRDFRAALAASSPSTPPSVHALEGYLSGRMAISILAAIEGEPTRAGFLSALKRVGRFDVGGIQIDFGAGDNQGLDMVFLVGIDEHGRAVPLRRTDPARP